MSEVLGEATQPSTLGFGTRCLDSHPQCQPLLVFALDEGQNLSKPGPPHPEHGGGNNSSHFTKLLRKNDILPTKCFVNIKYNTNYSDYCCPYLKGHLDLFLRLVATSGGNKVNKQHSSGSK